MTQKACYTGLPNISSTVCISRTTQSRSELSADLIGLNVEVGWILFCLFREAIYERACTGRPRTTVTRQERLIVRAAVAARTASREEIQAHVAPAVSARTTGNSLLVAGLRSRVPLARLPLYTTTPPSTATLVSWSVEWRSVVFSAVSRFCVYVSDGRTRLWHRSGDRYLPECFRPRHKGPTLGFMVWGYQLQLAVTFDVSAG